jgi:hypothetical protein
MLKTTIKDEKPKVDRRDWVGVEEFLRAMGPLGRGDGD